MSQQGALRCWTTLGREAAEKERKVSFNTSYPFLHSSPGIIFNIVPDPRRKLSFVPGNAQLPIHRRPLDPVLCYRFAPPCLRREKAEPEKEIHLPQRRALNCSNFGESGAMRLDALPTSEPEPWTP